MYSPIHILINVHTEMGLKLPKYIPYKTCKSPPGKLCIVCSALSLCSCRQGPKKRGYTELRNNHNTLSLRAVKVLQLSTSK